MKWRHSKEAQAQKDKDKEQPDKSTTEAEPKERDDSECESEPSESEFEDGPEDKSDVDICELNKTSVIIPCTSTEDTTNPTTEANTATQILLWGTVNTRITTSYNSQHTTQTHKLEPQRLVKESICS